MYWRDAVSTQELSQNVDITGWKNYEPVQRDHLIIRGMWRRSLTGVRVKADADIFSDHHLLVSHLKLKREKEGTPAQMGKGI